MKLKYHSRRALLALLFATPFGWAQSAPAPVTGPDYPEPAENCALAEVWDISEFTTFNDFIRDYSWRQAPWMRMAVFSESIVAEVDAPLALRLRGYVTIPASGNYRFEQSGTGSSILMVGADGTPFSKITAASQVTGVTATGEPFALEAGQRIYVEIIQIQNEAGLSFLDWAWIRPDGVREPIPAELWESFTLRDDDTDDNGLPDELESLSGIAVPTEGVSDPSLYGWAGDFNANGFTNLAEYQMGFNPAAGNTTTGSGAGSSSGGGSSGGSSSSSSTPASIVNGTFGYTGALSGWDNDGYYGPGFNWDYLTSDRLSGWEPVTGTTIELWSSGGKTFCELAATRDGGGIRQRIQNPQPGSELVFAWSHRARSGITASLNDYTVRIYRTGTPEGVDPVIKTKPCPGLPSGWTPVAMNFAVPKDFTPTQELWIEFVPSSTIGAGTLLADITLTTIPFAAAPEVLDLSVNTNFDEGKTATGYAILEANVTSRVAIPDAKDASLVGAPGTPNGDRVVTTDLYEGFFGIVPGKLPADFFEGATVYIFNGNHKDPETNQTKTGRIRLHAVTGTGASATAQALQISDSEGDDHTVSYGITPHNLADFYAAAPTDDSVKYWIEGVAPGPLTLQFIYTKGDVSFSRFQEFYVCTKKSKAEWQGDIRSQILLQSHVDMNGFRPYGIGPFPFMGHKVYLKMIYTYYAQLFAENPHLFHWAGAARTAGGPVYAGLSDSERGHAIGAAAFNASNPIPALQALKELLSAYGMGLADAASAYVDSQVTVIQQNFMAGAQNIFNDLAWQHRAYAASGIWALRHVDQNPAPLSNGEIPFNLDPWNALWKIDYTGDASTLFDEVVKPLAEREQHDLIQQEWNLIRERGGYELPPILSHLARSPYPGKMKFIKFAELIEAPGNDISLYADRWLWINHDDPSGVMQDFNAFTETYRFGFVMRALRDHAEDMKLIGTLIWEQ